MTQKTRTNSNQMTPKSLTLKSSSRMSLRKKMSSTLTSSTTKKTLKMNRTQKTQPQPRRTQSYASQCGRNRSL